MFLTSQELNYIMNISQTKSVPLSVALSEYLEEVRIIEEIK